MRVSSFSCYYLSGALVSLNPNQNTGIMTLWLVAMLDGKIAYRDLITTQSEKTLSTLKVHTSTRVLCCLQGAGSSDTSLSGDSKNLGLKRDVQIGAHRAVSCAYIEVTRIKTAKAQSTDVT